MGKREKKNTKSKPSHLGCLKMGGDGVGGGGERGRSYGIVSSEEPLVLGRGVGVGVGAMLLCFREREGTEGAGGQLQGRGSAVGRGGQQFHRRWGGVSLCEDQRSRGEAVGEAPAALGAQCGPPHPVRSRAGALTPPPRPAQRLLPKEGQVGSAKRHPEPSPGGPQRHAPRSAPLTPSLGFRVRPDHCPRLLHPGLIVPFCGVGGRVGSRLTFFFSKPHYIG